MKSIRCFLLACCTILVLSTFPAFAATPTEECSAQALYELGLFRGSDVGFELDRTPTRSEALVMLLRLTGAEDAALAGSWTHPFTDSGWADHYIGYAYENGITNGISATSFGAQSPSTAQQYATFLLRTLGYSSEDFVYQCATDYLLAYTPLIEIDEQHFDRGDMIVMSLAAMAAPLKDGSGTLADKMIRQGLFTAQDYGEIRQAVSPTPTAETTVLIYMVGSDLESYRGLATKDINEMLSAEFSDDVNVILQTGGTTTWHNPNMLPGATQRFQLTGNSIAHLSTLISAPMSQPSTLANFIAWGTSAYPAERYILILWNHGGGTAYGYGLDETTGGDSLMLNELNQALTWGGTKFELIGFDACLMATMSNAYMLSNHADYLLASAETEPLNGWMYTNWLTQLANDPNIPISNLAQTVAEDYLSSSKVTQEPATLSLIALDQMSHVMDEWQTLAPQLCDSLSSGNYDLFFDAILATKQYSAGYFYDQFDMIDWLYKLEERQIANTSSLRNAIQTSILFVKNNEYIPESCGLAIYYPFQKPENYFQNDIRSALLGGTLSGQDISFWDLLISNIYENGT